MSTSIDISFVRQYEREVHEAYQRQGSMLRGTVRTKNNVIGKSTTFQKIGKGVASSKGRHGLVTPMNQSHSTVEVTLQDWYAGDWIDKLDELKVEHDERQVVANAGAWALGRKTDELIIAALDGSTAAADAADVDAISSTNSAAVSIFADHIGNLAARDVPMGDGGLYSNVSQKVWSGLLTIDQFNRAEYVNMTPLAGDAWGRRRWMNSLFGMHTGLTVNSTSTGRICHTYHRTAVGHAIGAEVQVDITWDGPRVAHFVNHMMSQGAGLIDSEGVQLLVVDES